MNTSRRTFIARGLYGIFSFLGLGFLFATFRTIRPDQNGTSELVFFPFLPEEAFPRSGVKKADLTYSASGKERSIRLFAVAGKEGLLALSATCSHLGCLVQYSKEKREFVCPCHGGRYDLAGKNIAGPPPAPLTRFPIRIADGMVEVGVRVYGEPG